MRCRFMLWLVSFPPFTPSSTDFPVLMHLDRSTGTALPPSSTRSSLTKMIATTRRRDRLVSSPSMESPSVDALPYVLVPVWLQSRVLELTPSFDELQDSNPEDFSACPSPVNGRATCVSVDSDFLGMAYSHNEKVECGVACDDVS